MRVNQYLYISTNTMECDLPICTIVKRHLKSCLFLLFSLFPPSTFSSALSSALSPLVVLFLGLTVQTLLIPLGASAQTCAVEHGTLRLQPWCSSLACKTLLAQLLALSPIIQPHLEPQHQPDSQFIKKKKNTKKNKTKTNIFFC